MNIAKLDRLEGFQPAGETEAGRRDPIVAWIERAVAEATNNDRLRQRLDSIDTADKLLCFLQRFVVFNDALAARVPFLAGLIHLTPDLFLDEQAEEEFCRQCNGRIAAFVAEAASDEYQITERQNLVHQYLSQQFLQGAFDHFAADPTSFNRRHPLPPALRSLLGEARARFFAERTAGQIFAALGFHVGLEVFAHQEFTLLDAWLRACHPGLVAALERDNGQGSAYRWLAIHTVVEIKHYRAGLEALTFALDSFHPRDRVAEMEGHIRHGFEAFVDLQGRYYEAILADGGLPVPEKA
jgi:hypothetical protein